MNICGDEDMEGRFVGRKSDRGSADASMLKEGYEKVFPGEQEVEI